MSKPRLVKWLRTLGEDLDGIASGPYRVAWDGPRDGGKDSAIWPAGYAGEPIVIIPHDDYDDLIQIRQNVRAICRLPELAKVLEALKTVMPLLPDDVCARIVSDLKVPARPKVFLPRTEEDEEDEDEA